MSEPAKEEDPEIGDKAINDANPPIKSDTVELRSDERNSPEEEPSGEVHGPMSKPMAILKQRDIEDDFKDDDPEKTIKIVVVGDGTSGKTSMCTRFAQRDYVGKYNQTVGVDFFSRRISLVNNIYVMFQIFDIGGQSISSNMLSKYLFDANCIIFVYDVTNLQTFESMTDWVTVVKKATSKQERPIHMCLIGNKTDMEHRRTVRIDKHTRFADQYGMSSHYVSAKTGDSIDLSFRLIAAEVLGIQLSKIDVELSINAIEAPVAVLDEPTKEEAAKQRQALQIKPTITTREQEGRIDLKKDYTKQSSVCVVQ